MAVMALMLLWAALSETDSLPRIALTSDAAPAASGIQSKGDIGMQREREKVLEDEPVGIVISRGSRDQEEPRFSAYVWGKAPASSNGATKAA